MYATRLSRMRRVYKMPRLKQSRACIQCGASFYPDAGHARRGGGLYCTRNCWHAAPKPKREEAYNWGGGRRIDHRGYSMVYAPEHRRAGSSGYVREHLFIAEAALGHSLPESAVVHHVDGNKLNNSGLNLVICENQAYHILLHARQRVFNAGFDPNVYKFCSYCKHAKPISRFSRDGSRYNGIATSCKDCMAEYHRQRYKCRR